MEFQWLEEGTPFLLLVLSQLLMFPSHQLAVGRKKLSSTSFLAVWGRSKSWEDILKAFSNASHFNEPISFGAIDQVLVNYSWKKKS